jgi:hypothetical protein
VVRGSAKQKERAGRDERLARSFWFRRPASIPGSPTHAFARRAGTTSPGKPFSCLLVRLSNRTRNGLGAFRSTEAEKPPYFAILYVRSPASFFADSILMRCFLAVVER